jgi:AcrR family transcriptional regulator
MEDSEFDTALVGAALALAGEQGWRAMTVVQAARRAGLDLGRARARFPGKLAVLMRLGVTADQAALAAAGTPGVGLAGTLRDRLFDMIMQRLDIFQSHREGMQAVFRALPADPGLALLLLAATRRSMAWLLEAAGGDTTGLRGAVRVRGLTLVWLAAVRAWERDDSLDLSATMRAVADALQRAEQAARWLGGGSASGADAAPDPIPPVPPAAADPPPSAADLVLPEELPPMPPAPLDTPPEPEPPAAPAV